MVRDTKFSREMMSRRNARASRAMAHMVASSLTSGHVGCLGCVKDSVDVGCKGSDDGAVVRGKLGA